MSFDYVSRTKCFKRWSSFPEVTFSTSVFATVKQTNLVGGKVGRMVINRMETDVRDAGESDNFWAVPHVRMRMVLSGVLCKVDS